jgi:hypothetical protein
MSASASLLVTTSQLAVLIKLAECFNADGLVDAADADRRETTRGYQFSDRPAGFRIVRRIEKNGELRLAVCRRFERLDTYAAAGFNELSSFGRRPGNDLPRRLVGPDNLLKAALAVERDRVGWIDNDLSDK